MVPIERSATFPTVDGKTTLRDLPLLKMQDPVGLMTNWSDDRWTYDVTRGGRFVGMPFRKKMANGYRLNHPHNAEWLETIKRYQTAYRNKYFPGSEDVGLTTILGRTWEVISFADYVISLGCSSFKEFKYSQWLIFAFQKVRSGRDGDIKHRDSIRETFRVCADLSSLYLIPTEDGERILPDGLSFLPFSTPEEASGLAKNLGVPGGQTLDVPEEVIFRYLDASTETVMYHADPLIHLRDRWKDEASKPFALTRAKNGDIPRELAHAILAAIESDKKKFFVDGKASRSDLARAISRNTTVLYKKRYDTIIHEYELACRRDTPGDWDQLSKRLISIVIEQPDERAATNRDRNLPALIGLPFFGSPGKYSPWPIKTIGAKSENSLESALNNLWTASYIVIASFMAERIGETLALEIGCIEEGIDGYYLRATTFKGSNSEVGAENLQPCPLVVKEAVRVLTVLGHEARTAANSKLLLFSEHRSGASVLEQSTVRKRLKAFGVSTGAAFSESGDEWIISPMEMRRFFVTIWVNYFEFGGQFETLRKFLTHASVGTTIDYGRRRFPGAELSKRQRALTLKIMKTVAFDLVKASGAAAVRFDKLVGKIMVKVGSPDRMMQWMERRIDQHDIRAFPMPWGYCLWSKLSGETAECLPKAQRRSGISRPMGKKCAETCGGGCRQFLMTEAFEPFWNGAHDRHAQVANNPRAPRNLVAAAMAAMKIALRNMAKATKA